MHLLFGHGNADVLNLAMTASDPSHDSDKQGNRWEFAMGRYSAIKIILHLWHEQARDFEGKSDKTFSLHATWITVTGGWTKLFLHKRQQETVQAQAEEYIFDDKSYFYYVDTSIV